MGKVFIKLVVLFSPLLLALWGLDTATAGSVKQGFEMIGDQPESFSGRKNLVFQPNVLPKFGASHINGLSVTFKIRVRQSVSGWNVIFHGGKDPFRTPSMWFHSRSTRVHPRLSTSRNMNEGGDSSGNVFTFNKWHHAAYVLTNNKLLFYVDGKVVMQRSVSGKVKYPDGNRPFYIGYPGGYISFNGQLKSFRYYNFALSQQQVQQDASVSLNQMIGGGGFEMIGNQPESFSGKKNLVFQPSVLPKFGASHINGLSVTFKIRVGQYVSGWNVIFHGGKDPFRTPSMWFHSRSTRVHPRLSTTTNWNEGGDSSGNVFTLNKWHHAAYVLTNNKLLFYVDGKVVMQRSVSGKVKYPVGNRPFYIGYPGGYISFNGQLKSFRYYNFALSQQQVQQDASMSLNQMIGGGGFEMIGAQPESFSGKKNLVFPPSMLPKFGAFHINGLSVTFKIRVGQYVSGWNVIFHGGKDPFRTPSTWFYSMSTRVHPSVSSTASSNNWGDSKKNVFTLNKWHHAAYVVNSKKLLFYVDGKVVMQRSVPGKVKYPDGTQPFYIGHDTAFTSFNGQLKSFRYYNFALSQQQVQRDAFMSLNQIIGGGNTIEGNTLQMIGSKPMSFHGTKNLVVKPNLLPKFGDTHTKGLSVTFKILVRKYSKGCWNVIFHAGVDPFRTPATWLRPSTTRVHTRVSTSTNMNEGGDSSGNVFTLNKWHHAAYVLTNKKLLFYVDGKVVMTYNIKGKVKYPDGTHPFYIGHDTEYYSFDGELQFFRIYDFALTPKQIKKDGSSDKPITEEMKCCPCNNSEL